MVVRSRSNIFLFCLCVKQFTKFDVRIVCFLRQNKYRGIIIKLELFLYEKRNIQILICGNIITCFMDNKNVK